MSWRHVLAILISVLGVLVPLSVIIWTFGLDARVILDGPDTIKQLSYLVGCFLLGFACALGASVLYRDRAATGHVEILNQAMRAWAREQQEARKAA